MDFGVPGEAIGKALGGIFGPEKGKQEKHKRKRCSRKALAGDADPARRDFGRIRTWYDAESKTFLAHPVGMGGRIVCASRHPPRHWEAGGFEA